jgi:PIN domain nuclease of toxin-antitoxin system
MNKYVADTMAIVLYQENRRLPNNIKSIFDDTAQGKCVIYFSAVSLMEIGYLFEKQRIDTSIASVLQLTEENKNFIIHSLDAATISEAFKIKTIPELHDRLITATAAILKTNLITNDPIIWKSQYVNTIWQADN